MGWTPPLNGLRAKPIAHSKVPSCAIVTHALTSASEDNAMLCRKIGKLEQWFVAGVVMFGAALSVTGTFQAISNILMH